MNSPAYTFGVISVVLFYLILIQGFISLHYKAINKFQKFMTIIISGIVLVIMLMYTAFAFAFSYNPEHIVEKDGKKMVAYVNSFLHVRVEYYDYLNSIVRRPQVKITEDYGRGGYDPFEKDEMPSIKHYTYYDDNGKVIKSNY